MGRKRMTWKQGASLSIGDRTMPLEADQTADVSYDHPLIGSTIEVSCIAGGTLKDLRGKKAQVLGVIARFGQDVGYKVDVDGVTRHGSTKDFFLDRCVVEDAQPPTATSAALREGLSHWGQQRDYWHTDTSGLEALCFDLASVTPRAAVEAHGWGWQFSVPAPMPGEFGVVVCPAALHENFWTTTAMVYPYRAIVEEERLPNEGAVLSMPFIDDHWARVFSWTYAVATKMAAEGFPWEQAARGIKARATATAQVLVPLVSRTLQRALDVRYEVTGERPYVSAVSAGFSVVRLKAGTVGLTEPPTDRRPYTVMSISPSVAKDPEYLEQCVIHECVHIAVASEGGDPHGPLFIEVSEKMGLKPEHRD